MSECIFFKFGYCKILKDTKCSEECNFRKTEEQYLEGIAEAEKILKDRGVKRVIAQSDNGPIVTVKKI